MRACVYHLCEAFQFKFVSLNQLAPSYSTPSNSHFFQVLVSLTILVAPFLPTYSSFILRLLQMGKGGGEGEGGGERAGDRGYCSSEKSPYTMHYYSVSSFNGQNKRGCWVYFGHFLHFIKLLWTIWIEAASLLYFITRNTIFHHTSGIFHRNLKSASIS